MTHYSRISKLVINVAPADHDAEVAFWRGATGKPMTQFERYPEYHGADLDDHLGLLVQKLEYGDSRVHLDIHTDDLEAEVKRLEGLGAQRVAQHNSWWIMRDPAGLPFCVIPDRPGSMDETNATRWD
jgi:Glyoxalase-like domain